MGSCVFFSWVALLASVAMMHCRWVGTFLPAAVVTYVTAMRLPSCRLEGFFSFALKLLSVAYIFSPSMHTGSQHLPTRLNHNTPQKTSWCCRCFSVWLRQATKGLRCSCFWIIPNVDPRFAQDVLARNKLFFEGSTILLDFVCGNACAANSAGTQHISFKGSWKNNSLGYGLVSKRSSPCIRKNMTILVGA